MGIRRLVYCSHARLYVSLAITLSKLRIDISSDKGEEQRVNDGILLAIYTNRGAVQQE